MASTTRRLPYTTIAVRHETKRRLDKVRRARRLRSMEAVIEAALHEMEMQEKAAEIRRHAKGWEKAPRDPLIEEFIEGMEGLEDTVRAIRDNGGKRARRHRG